MEKLIKWHLRKPSKGGKDEKDNILRMPKSQHKALQKIFGRATASQQIEIVLNLNNKIICRNAARKIMNSITKDLRNDKFYE